MKNEIFKWILTVLFFVIGITWLEAEGRIVKDGVRYPPFYQQLVSQAVYMSTTICKTNSNGGENVLISTFPALFFAVNVTSPATAGSYVEFFDSNVTTTDVRSITGQIQTNAVNAYAYNIGTSSGLSFLNWGGTPGCFTAIYVER